MPRVVRHTLMIGRPMLRDAVLWRAVRGEPGRCGAMRRCMKGDVTDGMLPGC
jgi:hypothetical protein